MVSAASMGLALTSGRTNDGRLTNYGFGWYLGIYQGCALPITRANGSAIILISAVISTGR